MKWQPIETAPRDGRWFVTACFAEGREPFYEVGAYDPLTRYDYELTDGGLYRRVESIAYDWTGFNNFEHMTHWMPLPEPPQA